MTRENLDYASHAIYRPIVVLGGLSVILVVVSSAINSIDTINKSREEQAIAAEVKRIEESPTTDYFEYISVEPVRREFALGEPVRFVSNRSIHEVHPIGGIDTLLCDMRDDEGFTIISASDWLNLTPRIVSGQTAPRKYTGMLPQNPIGIYIEADCYVRSQIEMCVSVNHEQSVCKKQQVKSSIFNIVNK